MIVASQILVPEARRDPHTQYRAENVIIDNATYAPPPPNFDPMLPDKHEYRPVPAQIATMINELGHLEGDFHKAIYSHFHIARIHPFADGNGRLARLVQNAYLKRGNLLPIVIPSSERELYSSILDAGVQRFYEDSNDNERSSRYIHPFSEYLVSKMEHSFKLFKEKKVF